MKATILGISISAIIAPTSENFRFLGAPRHARIVAIYGDSIADGANASLESVHHGYAAKLATSGRGAVLSASYGYRTLNADTPAAVVAQLRRANPTDIWIGIGTNDYGLAAQSAADFGTDYAAMLDALHAAFPAAKLWAQTPLLRTNETANAFGDTLGAYRTAISTAVSTRAAYTTLVDGSTIIASGDLADGLHPGKVGHAKMAQAVTTNLGL